jgi:hypothetical protein
MRTCGVLTEVPFRSPCRSKDRLADSPASHISALCDRHPWRHAPPPNSEPIVRNIRGIYMSKLVGPAARGTTPTPPASPHAAWFARLASLRRMVGESVDEKRAISGRLINFLFIYLYDY